MKARKEYRIVHMTNLGRPNDPDSYQVFERLADAEWRQAYVIRARSAQEARFRLEVAFGLRMGTKPLRENVCEEDPNLRETEYMGYAT